MRASALALLSAAALASAQDDSYAIIVVEKADPEAFGGYSNSTVNAYLTEAYENPEILGEVTSLYQIYPWYTYFCFAYKEDGTAYGNDWFGIDKPLRLGSKNVPVASIQCNAE